VLPIICGSDDYLVCVDIQYWYLCARGYYISTGQSNLHILFMEQSMILHRRKSNRWLVIQTNCTRK